MKRTSYCRISEGRVDLQTSCGPAQRGQVSFSGPVNAETSPKSMNSGLELGCHIKERLRCIDIGAGSKREPMWVYASPRLYLQVLLLRQNSAAPNFVLWPAVMTLSQCPAPVPGLNLTATCPRRYHAEFCWESDHADISSIQQLTSRETLFHVDLLAPNPDLSDKYFTGRHRIGTQPLLKNDLQSDCSLMTE